MSLALETVSQTPSGALEWLLHKVLQQKFSQHLLPTSPAVRHTFLGWGFAALLCVLSQQCTSARLGWEMFLQHRGQLWSQTQRREAGQRHGDLCFPFISGKRLLCSFSFCCLQSPDQTLFLLCS